MKNESLQSRRTIWQVLGCLILFLFSATPTFAALLYEQNTTNEQFDGGADAQQSLSMTGTANAVGFWTYCDSQQTTTTGDLGQLTKSDYSGGKWFTAVADQVIPATTWTVVWGNLTTGDLNLATGCNSGACSYLTPSNAPPGTSGCHYGRSTSDVFQGRAQSSASKDFAFQISDIDYPFTPSPPVISNISSGTPTSHNATITWTTDTASDTTVEWGLDSSYSGAGSGSRFVEESVTSHSLEVPATGNLTAATTYHYRVCSEDAYAQETCSSDQTFQTAVALTISAKTATPHPTSATITWTTDVVANTKVQFGATASYGQTATIANSVTSHVLEIDDFYDLTPATTYHYRVCSTNAYSQELCSADGTFTTTTEAPPGPASGTVRAIPYSIADGDWEKTSFLNATGSCDPGDPPQDGTCVWYWRVSTDIPYLSSCGSDTAAVQWEISNDAGTVLCTDSDSLNTNDGTVMQSLFSPLVAGCPQFALSAWYNWRTRARCGSADDYGPWSLNAHVYSGADDYVPPSDESRPECSIFAFSFTPATNQAAPNGGSSGDGFGCVVDWFIWLMYPPSDTLDGFKVVETDLTTRWPMSYVSTGRTIYEGLTEATTDNCPFETATCDSLDDLTTEIGDRNLDDLFAFLIALGVLGFYVACGKKVAKAIYE